ncbi:MAG: hypothetical protein H6718_09900 [Polyangiaceae bacterium]|nr:hypothetical protein [Myxococcales bacterium]MCB9585702.1 hypothetical protein [Polyangiaceae bacterium]MCB9607369.1 hypothetical protein [Polyangiaceae bacterium]
MYSKERVSGRLTSYLGSLPNGLESYPECTVKTSLLRGLLAACPPLDDLQVQGPLRELLLDPPGANAWIPEAHFVAAHLAIADDLELSTEDMLQRTYQANKALTGSAMYRALASVASPALLLRGAKAGWGLIHRGVHLTLHAEKARARLVLTHPPHLYNSLAHESAAWGFRAVVEAAHGREVQAVLEQSMPTGASVLVAWA